MQIFGRIFDNIIIFTLVIVISFFSNDAKSQVVEVVENNSQITKKPVTKKGKEAPTKIRSDIMDIKRKNQTIDFFGNVIVEKEDSSMLADKMTVFYEEKDNKNSSFKEETQESSIKRINAESNVKVFSEEFIATGNSGYYEPKENLFVLEGNVIVNNGTSIANGNRFVYNTITKKGNFVGNKNEIKIKDQAKKYESLENDREDNRVVVIIGDDLEEQKKSKKTKDTNQ
ncbi:MAG: hypothetical protein KGQ36_03905 [Rickettsiales bacterium]|nr:hypothetical protein [Rickettsiales bacterium]